MLSYPGPMSSMLWLGFAGGVPHGLNPLRSSLIGALSCLLAVRVLVALPILPWKGKPLTAEIGPLLLDHIGLLLRPILRKPGMNYVTLLRCES